MGREVAVERDVHAETVGRLERETQGAVIGVASQNGVADVDSSVQGISDSPSNRSLVECLEAGVRDIAGDGAEGDVADSGVLDRSASELGTVVAHGAIRDPELTAVE